MKKLKQWLCGKFGGHRFGGDTGYMLGTKTVDRWCKRCGKHFEIPLDESNLMDTK